MRILRLAAVLAILVLVLPGASAAGNHAVFTDPVGDNQGGSGYASDITSVEITSADDGGFSIKVAMNDPQGHLFAGDVLNVGIDSDQNASNGFQGTGYDNYMQEFGSASGPPRFVFCNYIDRLDCSDYSGSEATDVPTGPNSHVVTFNNSQGGWTAIRLYAQETFTSSVTGARFFDTTSVFSFDMNADPDGDGSTGSADKCPTIKAGKTDKNRDGCPDPLPRPHYTYVWADSSAPIVAFREFRVTGAPSGATVTVRYPGGVARRRGSGAIKGIAGRALHVGSSVTIILSSPTRVGSFLVLRVGSGGVSTVRGGCTPVGSTKLLKSCP
jgi:hypothetical protein